jgi:uncharacterized membrane protein YdjX (TVP38/TMEM64 family)
MNKQRKNILFLVMFIAVLVAVRQSPLGSALTFENLRQHRDQLLVLVRGHYALSIVLFILLYIAVTGLSIPGAVVLTIGGGFLYGTVPATLYVNLGATAGAVLAFLFARYLLGEQLQDKYRQQLDRFNREMEAEGWRYLLTLRLIPIFPFFLINFLAGLTRVPLKTFAWTTALGIIPGTAVFAYAGRQIGSINSPADILSPKVIMAFLLLACFALFPAVLSRIKAARSRSGRRQVK